MLTYNRGQWGDDPAYVEEWTMSAKGLEYPGFDTTPSWKQGDDGWFHAHAYMYVGDEKGAYEFLVLLGEMDADRGVLVNDYPSLLMLMKEVEPLVRMGMDSALFEMREEEHQWKAREHHWKSEEYGRKSPHCGHMLKDFWWS